MPMYILSFSFQQPLKLLHCPGLFIHGDLEFLLLELGNSILPHHSLLRALTSAFKFFHQWCSLWV